MDFMKMGRRNATPPASIYRNSDKVQKCTKVLKHFCTSFKKSCGNLYIITYISSTTGVMVTVEILLVSQAKEKY